MSILDRERNAEFGVFGACREYILVNMGKEQQIATWMFMMLTAVRKRFGLSRSDFFPIVKEYGVIRFLIDQYELLHYYDNDYIVDDVLRYIEEQGGDAANYLAKAEFTIGK